MLVLPFRKSIRGTRRREKQEYSFMFLFSGILIIIIIKMMIEKELLYIII